jgi:translation initiation factor 1A
MLKEEGQEYAQVLRILGNCRIEAYCMDGKTRKCHVRGKFRKKVWINKDDIILIGLRDYQDGKADVIHKFSSDEARQLLKKGLLPPDGKNFYMIPPIAKMDLHNQVTYSVVYFICIL